MLARDVDAQPALAVASDAAIDGMGMVWQAKDGAVLYADAVHRKAVWPATFALDACILPLSVTWAKTLEGLCNDVRIRYGLPEAELHATHPASIAELGTFGASLTTRLASASDANARAQFMMIRQSSPAWVLAGVQVWLELIGAMRDLTAAANEADTAAHPGSGNSRSGERYRAAGRIAIYQRGAVDRRLDRDDRGRIVADRICGIGLLPQRHRTTMG